MKNKIAITTIILLVLCLALAFVACKETVAAPTNLDMSGNVLSWQAVDGAESYEVDVENLGTFTTKNTTFFVEVSATGSYKIRVRAVKGDIYSEYSEVYTYVVEKILATPEVSYDELSKVVSWNAVEGAAKYTVRVRYTDKDISSEGAIVEMTEVSGTSYALEKEEYTKPGSFTIEVKALAGEDSQSTDSAYSKPYVFANSATLASPVLSSITSTRVYWNSVSNASSYYLEARNKANADEVYSTTVNSLSSTNVSVLISNFKNGDKTISEATPGEYTVHIKAVGDGKVYQDSAMTDADDSFVIYKLPQLSEDCLTLTENSDGTTTATWKVTSEQLQLVDSFTLVLTPYDSEGDAVLSAQRVSFKRVTEENGTLTDEFEKLTKTESEGYILYSFTIDEQFRTIGEDNVVEYLLNNAYYGKRFTAELSSAKTGNGVVAGAAVTAKEQYLSYKTPIKDDADGYYMITSAAELAYIAKNPDADYKQTANIDFEGYEWLCVESFGGTFNGGEFVISNIRIIGEGENLGFFGQIKEGAIVAGLKLLQVSVSDESAKFCGAVAGVNNGTISDCVVIGSVSSKYAVAGGIVGVNNKTVSSSQSVADVTAAVAGCVAGKNTAGAQISYSSAKGNVNGKLEKSEDENAPQITEVYAGGLVAVNDGTVIYSYAIGNVVSKSDITLSSPNHAGGFVAINNGTIIGSYSGANYSRDYLKRNTVSAEGSANIAVGGFVGYNAGSITDSYANVKASSSNYVGGFVGFNADGASITNAYSMGGVVVNTNNVGGFSGNAAGTFTNVCYYDETLGDSASRTDKAVSEYVEFDNNFAQTIAGKLGNSFAVIGGENAVANAVLKGLIYNVTTSLEIGPGAKISATVQYVDNNGELKTITAGNESADGYIVCGNQNSEGTVVIVYNNGAARGIVIVTVD